MLLVFMRPAEMRLHGKLHPHRSHARWRRSYLNAACSTWTIACNPSSREKATDQYVHDHERLDPRAAGADLTEVLSDTERLVQALPRMVPGDLNRVFPRRSGTGSFHRSPREARTPYGLPHTLFSRMTASRTSRKISACESGRSMAVSMRRSFPSATTTRAFNTGTAKIR